MGRNLIAGPILGLLLCASSLGQDAQRIVESVASLSKQADTQAEFSKLIQLCDSAAQLTLTKPQQDYFDKLEAWACNKRGEIYSRQAESAQQAEDIRKWEAAALKDFHRAISKNPQHWQAIHNRGLSYASLGQLDRALADFELTIQLNPKYSTAIYNQAEILFEQQKFTQSLSAYERVLRIEPDDVGAARGKAHCLYHLEQYDLALQAYGQTIQLAVDDANAFADRADAYSDLGFWKQAIADYQRALQLDAQLPRAQQGLAWILATCPDDTIRQPTTALKLATSAIAQQELPDFRYLDTLAAAQAAVGQFDSAAQKVAAAMKTAPDGERPFLEHRLALYEKRQPYREPTR